MAGALVAALLSATALCSPSSAFADNGPGVRVGVVRWDAWENANQWEANLGPAAYHDRIPFYGSETGTNSVQIRQSEQSMKDEITYAERAGVGYWVFNWFGSGDVMSSARGRYKELSAADRKGINFALVINCCGSPTTSEIMADMTETYYEKTPDGRPILYMMQATVPDAVYDADFQRYIGQIRDAAAVYSLNPFIVQLAPDAEETSVARRSTLVDSSNRPIFDAFSSYADSPNDGLGNGDNYAGGPLYEGFLASNQALSENYDDYGQVVPNVTAGWDNRPRGFPNHYFKKMLPGDLKANLQNAITWVQNHPAKTRANTVLLYAWNEFDEGGWLAPTLLAGSAVDSGDPDGIATDRVAEISQVLKYASDSNWDNTDNYTAFNAFDGDHSTPWQSAGGAYSSHWLEVDFGKDMTFSQAVLSEYGGRTTSYDIQYMQGDTWKTAYSGTSIAQTYPYTTTPSFGPVTGRKARIKFNSGSGAPIIYEFQTNATDATQPNIALNKEYSASSVWMNDVNQQPKFAFDGNPSTNWQAFGNTSEWLEVNFGTRKAFNTATISEYGGRTQGFKIQYWDGASWQDAGGARTTISSGTPFNLGGTFLSDRARILWTSATGAPIVYEWSLTMN